MRLDFNILWVEDQESLVQSQKERITSLIKREGFRLQVVFASSFEIAKTFLSDDIYGDHIDLILMDYDLGTGAKGDEGLKETRLIFPYKDIIFYSSNANNLQDLAKGVQGVFFSERRDLPNTVLGVFDALVKKVLDIDHSRGIVMGASSDIDHHINEYLNLHFDKSNEEKRADTLTLVVNEVAEKIKEFGKTASKISGARHMSEIQKHHALYTSDNKIRLLMKLLQAEDPSDPHIKEIDEYRAVTIPKRNDLAHVRVQTEGFSRKLFDRNNNLLTPEDMKTLRQALVKFQDLFEELAIKIAK